MTRSATGVRELRTVTRPPIRVLELRDRDRAASGTLALRRATEPVIGAPALRMVRVQAALALRTVTRSAIGIRELRIVTGPAIGPRELRTVTELPAASASCGR